MTIIEAINQIDAMKPNSYSQSDKIKWLSNLDWSIKKEIIDTHEDDVVLYKSRMSKEEKARETFLLDKLDEKAEDIIAYIDEIIDEHTGTENEFLLNMKTFLGTKLGKTGREIVTELYTFNGYDENSSLDTILLVDAPYDEIYIRWLESQIDYANGEYGKYNNSITAYNTAWKGYMNYYNRKHMPLQNNGLKYF